MLGFRLQTVQPIACHHTTYAIKTPLAQLYNESCDFRTLYSWQISSCVKIYISNPMVWLFDIPIVSMNTNLKLVIRGTFVSCPKPLMDYTRNMGDVELTCWWLCGKFLELILCLVLSLALFSVTKWHFCMLMTWGLATAIQSKLAKQVHGSFFCARWKAGRKVCSVVYCERCWQPTIISVGI